MVARQLHKMSLVPRPPSVECQPYTNSSLAAIPDKFRDILGISCRKTAWGNPGSVSVLTEVSIILRVRPWPENFWLPSASTRCQLCGARLGLCYWKLGFDCIGNALYAALGRICLSQCSKAMVRLFRRNRVFYI